MGLSKSRRAAEYAGPGTKGRQSWKHRKSDGIQRPLSQVTLRAPRNSRVRGDKSEGGLAAENVLKSYGKMLLLSWLEFVYPSIGSWGTTGDQNKMWDNVRHKFQHLYLFIFVVHCLGKSISQIDCLPFFKKCIWIVKSSIKYQPYPKRLVGIEYVQQSCTAMINEYFQQACSFAFKLKKHFAKRSCTAFIFYF